MASEAKRTRLAAFSDQLLGGAIGFPAASTVVTITAVEELTQTRPDLAAAVRAGLEWAEKHGCCDIFELEQTDQDSFDAFAVAIAGVYLTDPSVAAALGYSGRLAIDVGSAERTASELRVLTGPVVKRGTSPWRFFEDTHSN